MKKNCKRCKELKELSSFNRKPSNFDGHTSTCKSCTSTSERERRLKKQKELDYYRQFEIC